MPDGARDPGLRCAQTPAWRELDPSRVVAGDRVTRPRARRLQGRRRPAVGRRADPEPDGDHDGRRPAAPALPELVAGINANNARLPTLWADGDFTATIVEPAAEPGGGARSQFVNGQVRLLYAVPGKLRIIGRKDVAGTVFDTGTDGAAYWLDVGGDADVFWYGALAGSPPPLPPEATDGKEVRSARAADLPIRPDLLRDVLGVGPIGPDLMSDPAPLLADAPSPDLYAVRWVSPSGDPDAPHLAVVREVLYDRATLLPRRVELFDARGRVAVRAYLSKFSEVSDAAPDAAGRRPRVATSYELEFPDTASRLTFDLDALALTRAGAPNARTFVPPVGSTKARTLVRVVP